MDQKLAMRLQQQGLGFQPEFQPFNEDQPSRSRNGHDTNPANSNNQFLESELYNELGIPTTEGGSHEQQMSHAANDNRSGSASNAGDSGVTSQPLWSLYPNQMSQIDPDVNQFSINQVASESAAAPAAAPPPPPPAAPHSNQATNGTGPNQFLAFAGESQNQRHSLMRHSSDTVATHKSQQHNHHHQQQQQIPQGYEPLQPYEDPRSRYQRNHSIHGMHHHESPRGYVQPVHQPQPQFPQTQHAPQHHHHHHHHHHHQHSPPQAHTPEIEEQVAQQRGKYKARSSIPPDLSSANYAEQCISAAISSRLPPFRLHVGEYNLLRSHLSYIHVTTYLNIRNGILRLWLSNPLVSVTKAEAAGCARDERFYGLAEVAYEWLVRNGYINFGCIEHTQPESVIDTVPEEQKKPRMTLVVVGAGIAGLSCARQLDSLLKRYSHCFSEYEDIPRVIVLEGRRRIGGRIYSAPLKSDHNCLIDLGAQAIMGYGKGNPLAVLVRRQLGLPVVPVERPSEMYDELKGKDISTETKNRIDKLFSHILSKMAEFKNEMPQPNTAQGDEVLMRAAKDPNTSKDDHQEHQTIAKLEENDELPRPYEDPGELSDGKYGADDPETIEELKFLKSIGMNIKPDAGDESKSIHVAPEPQGEMYPTLGQTMDSMVQQLSELAELTPEDLRLLNWHYADLEYRCGIDADNLSLGSWNQDKGNEFAGKHSMIQNGYQSLTRGLYIYPEKLDVRFKTSVKVIEYDPESADVFLENGEKISGDRVALTVPLGVLKDRTIQFIPDLPQWKTDSIERLGFGVTNKICLIYEAAFWDESKDVICVARDSFTSQSVEQEDYKSTRGAFYVFWNCTKAVGKPCLVGSITGESATQVTNEADEVIVEQACAVLEKIYPQSKNYGLVESIVTRWQIDPFARGSYSYVGPEATGADYDLMARPITNSVYFAGEATCRLRPGTVHGAYISGARAASEILTSLIGDIEIPYPLIPPRDYNNSLSRAHVHSAPPQQHSLSSSAPGSQIGKAATASSHFNQRPVRSSMASPAPMHPGAPSQMELGDPWAQRHYDTNAHRPNPVRTPSYSSQDMLMENAMHNNYHNSLKRKNENLKYDETTEECQTPEERLQALRDKRTAADKDRLRHDLIQELGERPIKPERSGANPFLIFQKDFWDICRQDTDEAKRKATGDPNAKAARNEVRAALGKMWRELPDAEKKPYLEATKTIKETNTRNLEEFKKKEKRYEAEAADFRRRWWDENATKPSEEEAHLMKLIQESKEKEKRQRRR